ncbi:SIS domain-containing protein [Evansella clarkii]|uniref:SIS domain-containing protein n=1 Tax=Evansella clarkii TaxID=79879 RepID=UPI000B4354E2|nr:SIS domain-containing protein [Evansella clarkii]
MNFRYIQEIEKRIKQLGETEKNTLEEAASHIIRTLRQDGMIHIFGTGHSHLLAEEAFYRAGGLVSVRPILIEELMLHESAWRSSEIERQEGYAENFMKDQPVADIDTVIVVSTSGRNPVPVDVAKISKEKGASVIAITSKAYAATQSSRHPSGKFLMDMADCALDNHSPVGDAVLSHPNLDTPYSPTSTVMGAILLHTILSEAIEKLAEENFPLPILKSGNVDKADEHNKALLERYKTRNELLQ